MGLQVLWFIVIAFFWTGFFILEGFDMGVGALHMVVGRTDIERRVAINTIGPFWDGNEVWLIVAGAATFAAFPSWYASMFSALYLAMMLVLLALIIRGVSFEYRGKLHQPPLAGDLGLDAHDREPPAPTAARHRPRRPPPRAAHQQGGQLYGDLPGPLHRLWRLGRGHLAGPDAGPRRHLPEPEDHGGGAAARPRLAGPLAWVAALFVLGFFIWTHVLSNRGVLPNPIQIIAFLLAVGAAWAVRDRHTGWAFGATTATIAATVVSIFVSLYPNVMVSSTNAAYNLTVANSASSNYALTVMTVVAAIFTPLVLAYQGWSYYVFRGRIKAPAAPSELATSARPLP